MVVDQGEHVHCGKHKLGGIKEWCSLLDAICNQRPVSL